MVMPIGAPHAADQEVRQADSPASSADENDAIASLPAHWRKPVYMVRPYSMIAINSGSAQWECPRMSEALVIGDIATVTDCCRQAHIDENLSRLRWRMP